MLEEAEALLHASAMTNRFLKVILTLSLLLILSILEYGVVNAVIDNLFVEGKYWVAMLCDSASLTLPLVCLGLFTSLPFQLVQIVGSSPFLLMVFCSTTFSPVSIGRMHLYLRETLFLCVFSIICCGKDFHNHSQSLCRGLEKFSRSIFLSCLLCCAVDLH